MAELEGENDRPWRFLGSHFPLSSFEKSSAPPSSPYRTFQCGMIARRRSCMEATDARVALINFNENLVWDMSGVEQGPPPVLKNDPRLRQSWRTFS